jgi:hypothetical protein
MRRAQCRMASNLLRKYCASRGNVRWLPLSADREVMPAAQEKRHEHGPLVQQGIVRAAEVAARISNTDDMLLPTSKWRGMKYTVWSFGCISIRSSSHRHYCGGVFLRSFVDVQMARA